MHRLLLIGIIWKWACSSPIKDWLLIVRRTILSKKGERLGHCRGANLCINTAFERIVQAIYPRLIASCRYRLAGLATRVWVPLPVVNTCYPTTHARQSFMLVYVDEADDETYDRLGLDEVDDTHVAARRTSIRERYSGSPQRRQQALPLRAR